MILWHGSEYRFDEFDLKAIGTGDGKSVGGWGIYFSTSKQVADRYTLPKGQLDQWDVNIHPNNMFDFDSYDHDQYNRIIAFSDSDNLEEFEKDYEDCNGKQLYDWLALDLGGEKEASEFLNSIGYDGAVMQDRWTTDATNYIMFTTSKIRGKVQDDEDEMYEDGEAGPGYTTLDSVPGMGTPAFPTRTSNGSGDIAMPSKRRRVKKFKEFKKTKK